MCIVEWIDEQIDVDVYCGEIVDDVCVVLLCECCCVDVGLFGVQWDVGIVWVVCVCDVCDFVVVVQMVCKYVELQVWVCDMIEVQVFVWCWYCGDEQVVVWVVDCVDWYDGFWVSLV